jgi:hypothetical protein
MGVSVKVWFAGTTGKGVGFTEAGDADKDGDDGTFVGSGLGGGG